MKLKFSDRELNFLVGINVLILVVATLLSKGDFLDVYNFQSMGGQLPELGLLAMGVALSMISGNGGIDLSGVALANLAGVVAATLAPQLAAHGLEVVEVEKVALGEQRRHHEDEDVDADQEVEFAV